MERLQKVIANSGYCSRRHAEELISKGEVKVNGEVELQRGKKLRDGDVVSYNGEEIKIVG